MQVSSLEFRELLLLFALSLALAVVPGAANWAGALCPSFCRCDLFEGLRHADCSYQRLISPNVELALTVEILDLGGNDITILDNSCFQGFESLRSLVLSHNAIHTIYLDAFSPLRNATHVDLAHNRLEYVDERIFEANRRLRHLDLAGNKFMSLQNKPLLRSTSLRSLSLRSAQLTYVYGELFRALPNLRSLDLSENLMVTLNAAALAVLPRLEQLQLSANRWRCERGLLKAVELVRKRGVRVELRECGVDMEGGGGEDVAEAEVATTTSHKFERMQLSEVEFVGTAEPRDESRLVPQIRADIQAIWRHLKDDDDDDDDDSEERDQDEHRPGPPPAWRVRYPSEVERCDDSWSRLCHQYRRCLTNMSRLLVLDKAPSGDSRGGIEPLTRRTYTSQDLEFVFVMGVSLGVTLVTLVLSCIMCVRRCCEARRRPTAEYVVPEAGGCREAATDRSTTPPSAGQQRRRAPAPERAAVVRRDYARGRAGDDSFLGRLFGRPARHHYYRSTATLVRRLSRSNLFSNRLSQHYAAEGRRQEGGEESPGGPSSPEDFAAEPFADRETATGPTPRPETPPPAYGEVVVVNMRK